MNAKREKAELLIYEIMDTVDPTHTNSDYYRGIFSKMSDEDFTNFFKRRLPLRYHEEVFKTEPEMSNIIKAFKILDKPLLEKVKLPYIYTNKDGVPVESKECLVVYIHIKRMKQMLTKKNNSALNTDKRDMKTGLLVGEDKGGKETDREFESLAIMGLDYTMDEFARSRADAMGAKSQMSNVILNKGYVKDSDIIVGRTDSIAKNLLNTYLIGSNIHSNLVDIDYMTPLTAKNKKKVIEREE